MSRTIREERRGDVPLFVHPEWETEFPWLAQGTTGREAGDFASFGSQPVEVVYRQWTKLRNYALTKTSVIGRQVHGNRVLVHGPLSPGMLFADDSDGQMTTSPGVLLAVSIADCVPVTIVDPDKRAIAVLHSGWRGTAAGILKEAIGVIGTNVRVHLGPAICGICYEVGPEVHQALGLSVPAANTPVDLRAVLLNQCRALNIREDSITTSAWCTRCGDTPFYSHRGGDPERQVTVAAIR